MSLFVSTVVAWMALLVQALRMWSVSLDFFPVEWGRSILASWKCGQRPVLEGAMTTRCPPLQHPRMCMFASEHVARFLAVWKYVAMRGRDEHVGECAPRTRQKSCNWRHRPRPRRAVVTGALAVGSL